MSPQRRASNFEPNNGQSKAVFNQPNQGTLVVGQYPLAKLLFNKNSDSDKVFYCRSDKQLYHIIN